MKRNICRGSKGESFAAGRRTPRGTTTILGRRRPRDRWSRSRLPLTLALGRPIRTLCILQLLQRGRDLRHARAFLRVASDALLSEDAELEGPFLWVLPLQPPVGDLVQPVLVAQTRLRPVHDALLRRRLRFVEGPSPRQQLQQHHPEAVHIGFRRKPACNATETARSVSDSCSCINKAAISNHLWRCIPELHIREFPWPASIREFDRRSARPSPGRSPKASRWNPAKQAVKLSDLSGRTVFFKAYVRCRGVCLMPSRLDKWFCTRRAERIGLSQLELQPWS